MDNNHIVGIIVGFVVGIIKAISAVISSLSSIFIIISLISWEQVFDTGLLALIGGALGWVGAEIAKRINKFYHKRKKK